MGVDFHRYTNSYCPGHIDCKADEKALINKLTLAVLITPLITLLLNGYCYFFFRRKTSDRRRFQQLWLAIIIFSFILNFIWEMLQMPLYKNMTFSWQSTSFCALASVADMLMVLLLYNAFTVFTKSSLWVFSIFCKTYRITHPYRRYRRCIGRKKTFNCRLLELFRFYAGHTYCRSRFITSNTIHAFAIAYI